MQRWFGLRANPSLALKHGAEFSFIPRPTWLYKNGSESERSEGRCPDRGARLPADLTFGMACTAIPRHARTPICGRDGCVGLRDVGSPGGGRTEGQASCPDDSTMEAAEGSRSRRLKWSCSDAENLWTGISAHVGRADGMVRTGLDPEAPAVTDPAGTLDRRAFQNRVLQSSLSWRACVPASALSQYLP